MNRKSFEPAGFENFSIKVYFAGSLTQATTSSRQRASGLIKFSPHKPLE
jgi:hypothetical protein